MNKKQVIDIVIVMFALSGCVFTSVKYRSPEMKDEMCPVKRKYYPLRHWVWSGLPGEGGFIPDPHFLWSDPMSFPEAITMADCQNATFQIMDINPYFNDESSEILLLIKAGNSCYEYSLLFPKGTSEQAVLADGLPSVRVFQYERQLAFVANFSNVKGVYLISLPFKNGSQIDLIPVNTPEFEIILSQLHLFNKEKSIKNHFCETRRNDFIALYEKYGGLCEKKKFDRSSVEENFSKFWK